MFILNFPTAITVIEKKGCFSFNQTFRNLKLRNGEKGEEDFLGKSSEKPENCRISESEPFNRKFRKRNGTEINGKKFSKISVYLARLSTFLEILVNVVPFASGSCSCRKSKYSTLISVLCLLLLPSEFLCYEFSSVTEKRIVLANF